MSRPVNTDRKLSRAVGARLRQARVARGLKQTGIAEVIGVEPETVSRYERGLIPISLSQLFQIADALGVGVDVLLGVNTKVKGGPKARRQADLLHRWGLLDRKGQELILGFLRRMVP